jgi:hypothetical protein
MSGISFINRVTGATNNIVYLETTDTIATATASSYITAQTANITALNDGAWTWEINDCIMLSASDGIGWCSIDSTFATLSIFSALTVNAVTHSGALVAGNLVKASAAGVIVDQGFAMKSVAKAAVAGGAAAQTVTDAFCTSGSMVTASWNDTTNAVNIQTVAAGNGSFVVTSSGDPGASHLNYIITK